MECDPEKALIFHQSQLPPFLQPYLDETMQAAESAPVRPSPADDATDTGALRSAGTADAIALLWRQYASYLTSRADHSVSLGASGMTEDEGKTRMQGQARAPAPECSPDSRPVGPVGGATAGAEPADLFKDADLDLRPSHGYAGLVNQGATCYLNSLLQTLYHSRLLRQPILSWSFDAGMHGEEALSIPRQLQTLFARLLLSSRRALTTTALTKSFRWTDRDAFQQHDASELMCLLVSALEQSVEDPRAFLDTIQGRYCASLRCLVCGSVRDKVEPFSDISLDIEGCSDLAQALAKHTAPEVLAGENQTFCAKCARKTDTEKRLQLRSAPKVLFVQLKRFGFDFTLMQRVKHHGPLAFPPVVDLAPCFEPSSAAEAQAETETGSASKQGEGEKSGKGGDGSQPSSSSTSTTSTSTSPLGTATSSSTVYAISAVLVHSGSASSGHYYAYVKPDRGAQWLRVDDERVYPVSAEVLPETFGLATAPPPPPPRPAGTDAKSAGPEAQAGPRATVGAGSAARGKGRGGGGGGGGGGSGGGQAPQSRSSASTAYMVCLTRLDSLGGAEIGDVAARDVAQWVAAAPSTSSPEPEGTPAGLEVLVNALLSQPEPDHTPPVIAPLAASSTSTTRTAGPDFPASTAATDVATDTASCAGSATVDSAAVAADAALVPADLRAAIAAENAELRQFKLDQEKEARTLRPVLHLPLIPVNAAATGCACGAGGSTHAGTGDSRVLAASRAGPSLPLCIDDSTPLADVVLSLTAMPAVAALLGSFGQSGGSGPVSAPSSASASSDAEAVPSPLSPSPSSALRLRLRVYHSELDWQGPALDASALSLSRQPAAPGIHKSSHLSLEVRCCASAPWPEIDPAALLIRVQVVTPARAQAALAAIDPFTFAPSPNALAPSAPARVVASRAWPLSRLVRELEPLVLADLADDDAVAAASGAPCSSSSSSRQLRLCLLRQDLGGVSGGSSSTRRGDDLPLYPLVDGTGEGTGDGTGGSSASGSYAADDIILGATGLSAGALIYAELVADTAADAVSDTACSGAASAAEKAASSPDAGLAGALTYTSASRLVKALRGRTNEILIQFNPLPPLAEAAAAAAAASTADPETKGSDSSTAQRGPASADAVEDDVWYSVAVSPLDTLATLKQKIAEVS